MASNFCPCGRVTGHGDSCSGDHSEWWCEHCQEIHRLDEKNKELVDAIAEALPFIEVFRDAAIKAAKGGTR